MSRNLNRLEVWKKARAFKNTLSIPAKSFPDHEKYKLADQIVRASRSVSANIAQGHGRFHFQENIQFCRQAGDSLTEMRDHLTVALNEQYIDSSMFDMHVAELEEVAKMLNGYIACLQKRKNDG